MTEAATTRRTIGKLARAKIRARSERRVYVLPADLVGKVLAYQADKCLPSEVAAARELLDIGLAMKGFANAR